MRASRPRRLSGFLLRARGHAARDIKASADRDRDGAVCRRGVGRVSTLRSDIRAIVDAADGWLTSPEIRAAVTRPCTPQVFGVTLTQMCDAKQLRKRKAPKSRRSNYAHLVYGPGPKPVSDTVERETRVSATKGFMQLARERRAKERARRQKACGA